MIYDYDLLKEKTTIEKINLISEASPVSNYEFWQNTQKRMNHKRNLSFRDLEHRLKDIFKTIDGEIFIDSRPDFERIKKKLLKQSHLKESKLKSYLTGKTQMEESCNYIKEVINL
jgi:hypothetical protein